MSGVRDPRLRERVSNPVPHVTPKPCAGPMGGVPTCERTKGQAIDPTSKHNQAAERLRRATQAAPGCRRY